ncbi:MAG: DUF2769 domain-containing protein [Thermoleophilia bacterium]|nr:DUF2769 domain-containing protein [Thermoleophilia bacterium]
MNYVPDVPENVERCSCPGCTSNPLEEGALYCGRDLHPEHVGRKGCECGRCPVFLSYQLSGEYFCEAPLHR